MFAVSVEARRPRRHKVLRRPRNYTPLTIEDMTAEVPVITLPYVPPTIIPYTPPMTQDDMPYSPPMTMEDMMK